MQLRMKNLLTFFIRLRHVSLTYMHKTENWKQSDGNGNVIVKVLISFP